MNVIYIPLDERPCNYDYPRKLSELTNIDLVIPSRNLLGKKKKPADLSRLLGWLEAQIEKSDHLIVSIDMLLYGGIVPSRLHQETIETCRERLNILTKLKEKNPKLKIYAYDLIMRVPGYNSSDEEPDYYATYGASIFKLGWLLDKKEFIELTVDEENQIQELKATIPADVKADYFERREKNFTMTNDVLKLVDQDVIDYLIIPLDDNSEYGFTAKEQRQLLQTVYQQNLLSKVSIYPGADEIGCTLFARVFCEINDYTPAIYTRYSSLNGPFIIPRYEDRSLAESVKSHITAAGGVLTSSDDLANFILMIHSPPVGQEGMAESTYSLKERAREYYSEVNIPEFIQAIKYYRDQGKNVALADVAVANGADKYVMEVFNKEDLLKDLIAYAGWNTNGNTMGTVVAHAIIASYYSERKQVIDRTFYYSRLIEDWGYQSIVRQKVTEQILPELGLTSVDLQGRHSEVETIVGEMLNDFSANLSVGTKERLKVTDVQLPWKRMFEVDFSVE